MFRKKIRKMFGELDCLCLSEVGDTLELMSNEGVRFDVIKKDKGYVVCENEVYPEPFKIWFKFKGDLTMHDVKEVVDSISNLRSEYINHTKKELNGRFGKESSSMTYCEVYDFCSKLEELGVETFELYPDKIEFVWYQHICTYKNGWLECGPVSMVVTEISKLDTEELDRLIGKLPELMQLTDEQLNRVGNLIDLYEDKYNYLLGLQEEMSYIDMIGTKLYRNDEQVLAAYVNLIEQLQNTFQSGFLDITSIGDAVLSYILKGE